LIVGIKKKRVGLYVKEENNVFQNAKWEGKWKGDRPTTLCDEERAGGEGAATSSRASRGGKIWERWLIDGGKRRGPGGGKPRRLKDIIFVCWNMPAPEHYAFRGGGRNRKKRQKEALIPTYS